MRQPGASPARGRISLRRKIEKTSPRSDLEDHARFGEPPIGALAKPAPLFDQLQQDRATPALTFTRFGIRGPFGGLHIPQHRIAQRLQFRVLDSIEFDSKLENGHRHQLRGVAVAAEDKAGLTLLKSGQNRVQSFF
jgi:hypothetical protein